LILIGFQKGYISLYSCLPKQDSFEKIEDYFGHYLPVRDIVNFGSHHKGYFISFSYDKTIKVWSIGNSIPIYNFGHDNIITCLTTTSNYNSGLIVFGDSKGKTFILNKDSNESLINIEHITKDNIRCVLHLNRLSPHNLLLTSSFLHISLWDLNTCTKIMSYHGGASSLFYWKQGIFFSTCKNEFGVIAWNVENGQKIRSFEIPDAVALQPSDIDNLIPYQNVILWSSLQGEKSTFYVSNLSHKVCGTFFSLDNIEFSKLILVASLSSGINFICFKNGGFNFTISWNK
jgi:WD40 repeat protein